MDISRSLDRRALFDTFKAKLPRPSQSRKRAKPSDSQLRVLRGFGILLIAWCLAWMTENAIHDRSIDEHLRSHWPNRAMWEGTLHQMGYSLIHDSKLEAQLLEHLHSTLDLGAGIWASEPVCLIYLSESPMTPNGPELWSCRPNAAPPQSWTELGPGLFGFQKIQSPPVLKSELPIKPSNPIDPKEIRY